MGIMDKTNQLNMTAKYRNLWVIICIFLYSCATVPVPDTGSAAAESGIVVPTSPQDSTTATRTQGATVEDRLIVEQSKPEPKEETESPDVQAVDQSGTEAQLIESVDDADPVEVTDLWDRLRTGFRLDHNHPGIQSDLRWYASNQKYLDRVAERARPFLYYIVTETEKRNMPLEIALLPVVESAFQTFAYSHGRAAGIWQFIPGTGRMYGLRQNWWYDGRRDVWASTQAALKYLSALHKKFDDWELALAAYNSGSGTVRKAIRKNLRRGRATDFWSLRRNLPKETRGYVPKLLAISAIVADPQKYGIELNAIADEPFLAKVDLDSQLDLALAAEMADMSIDEIYGLNPAFNRWATEPNDKNALLIPLAKEQAFKQRLASLPPEKRIRWERHRIRRGETIGQIARRFNTTSRVIRKVNKLRGNTIRQGKNLIIPVAVKDKSHYSHTADKRKKKIQNTHRRGRVKKTYTVKQGDSFWTISRKYNVGMRKLAKWNAMAPRDRLSVGQKLVVWTKHRSKTITSIDTSRLVMPPNSRTKRWIRYKVRRGDSLARIASKFKVTVAQLRKWNKKLRRKKYIQPGQSLKLFVDVTRQS